MGGGGWGRGWPVHSEKRTGDVRAEEVLQPAGTMASLDRAGVVKIACCGALSVFWKERGTRIL